MVENGSSRTPHVDEGTMHAWLDGALPAEEGRAVEAHVASCAACAASAAEARGLIAASTRILSALDDVPGGVVPSRSAPAAFDTQPGTVSRVRSGRSVRAFASVAAAAVVVVALTLVARDRSAPVTRAAPAVAARSSDASTGNAPAKHSPESSVATTSDAPGRPNRSVAQKPRAATPDAPRSQAASAPLPGGVAAGVTGAANATVAPSSDSLTVTGRVTAAATGLPVADARVSVAGTDAVSATDSSGTFKVSVPPAGSHVLTARKLGFAASSATVNLPEDHMAPVTLALRNSTTSLAEVVTSGAGQGAMRFAKSPPSITGARMVSSDVYHTGGSQVRRSTFQLDSGGTVTLEEWRQLPETPWAKGRSDTSTRADTRARAAQLMLRAPSRDAPQPVVWFSADSTMFVLSGQLPLKQLEELKKRVVP